MFNTYEHYSLIAPKTNPTFVPYHSPLSSSTPLPLPLNLLPPELGVCVEWNGAMAALSGVPRRKALQQSILSHVFGGQCRFARADGASHLLLLINQANGGQAVERAPFAFYNAKVRRGGGVRWRGSLGWEVVIRMGMGCLCHSSVPQCCVVAPFCHSCLVPPVRAGMQGGECEGAASLQGLASSSSI